MPLKKENTFRAKDAEDNSGPTTTVFVGNISEKASDMLVRQLLAVSPLELISRNTFLFATYKWPSYVFALFPCRNVVLF